MNTAMVKCTDAHPLDGYCVLRAAWIRGYNDLTCYLLHRVLNNKSVDPEDSVTCFTCSYPGLCSEALCWWGATEVAGLLTPVLHWLTLCPAMSSIIQLPPQKRVGVRCSLQVI